MKDLGDSLIGKAKKNELTPSPLSKKTSTNENILQDVFSLDLTSLEFLTVHAYF